MINSCSQQLRKNVDLKIRHLDKLDTLERLLDIKVLTRLAKVQPNPISFCMDHGAYNSSCIGPIWAHEVLRGPRYRAFSGTTLGQHPGKEGYFQQVAI